MTGIVFLDRDGTLIEDAGYLSDPGGIREIPGASEALRRLAAGGYLLAVVSNQGGVAKGRITESEMREVHGAFVERFRRKGVEFAAVEYCPHHPDGTVPKYRLSCRCRKPATGMADRVLTGRRGAAAYTMWVVGDKMSDVLFGRNLGAKTILVATGYGKTERAEGRRRGIRADRFLPSIREAAEWILSGR